MNPRKDLVPKLAAIQERLGSAQGKKYWRTLEELADSEAFQELMRQEFPHGEDQAPSAFSRRQFLSLMGASLALAGLSGCSIRPAPSVTLVPRVRPPEEELPGRPLFYATAMTLGGVGVGLLVESHMGRPTKIEGNPQHPGSLGATDIFQQASVLTLYDPDRSQTVTRLGQTRTWEDAVSALRAAVEGHRARRGAGLRLLTETVVSPTLGSQIGEFLCNMRDAKWHQYEPLARDNTHRGAVFAFGETGAEPFGPRSVSTQYDFREADVVLALDADFLSCGPGKLRYIADFILRRRVRTTAAQSQQAEMNRLYVIEPAVTNTGAKADHRLAVRGSEIEGLARALAAQLHVRGGGGQGGAPTLDSTRQRWITAVARDLEAHRGRCLVLAGERQPPVVHLLTHALNHHLGNVGQTVFHTAPIEVKPVDHLASLRELAEDMERGAVETLVILGGNPAFTAPADFSFGERIRKMSLRLTSERPASATFHLSLYQDETSRLCQWHIPEAHYLEAWSDTRAYDGTASIVQPLIEPLYHGRSAHEVLSILNQQPVTPPYETVQAFWRRHWGDEARRTDFEERWQTAVHDGVIDGTTFPIRSVSMQSGWEQHLTPRPSPLAPRPSLEIAFAADPSIYDGRFANNGWLQELPKPITKLTWENAAIMSPATARELNVDLGSYAHGGEHGGYHPHIVELRLGDATVRAPVWIMPGHADGVITVNLGYGRDAAGRLGGTSDHKVGFNGYALRTSEHAWFAAGLSVAKTGERGLIACTQQHHLMENRETVRSTTLQEYRRHPRFAADKDEEQVQLTRQRGIRRPLTMYEPFPYPERKWGMAIDVTACVGCNACVIACQAENNIPVVGKGQVAAGREMHWIRVDRYIEGPFDSPREFHFQPVPCMHCENAPCEYVCPVEATVHSSDGLNDMIYQRCVGTRFCSNNCPYKVRRFNFFHYADYDTPSLRLQYNPDVTVRSRGVMEKCSYCVQRIRRAEIDADVQGRPIIDGDILTACQAVCPAQAIVFGDINDRASTVKQWKDSPLHYGLLADLNTHPRTTYLAALRNPNPELERGGGS